MKLVRKIKTFLHNPWSLGQKILENTWWLWSDKKFLQLYYLVMTRRVLHLDNPRSFCEKLQWLKLNDRKPKYTTMVDKAAVKEYVAKIIGEKYIIPTIAVYNTIDDIDLGTLPDKFVLKTTHGGGSCGVIVCTDKNSISLGQIRKRMTRAMKQDSYKIGREWPYKDVQKRIIAEKYLESDEELKDYKFFCFNGVPKYCQVISDRTHNETIDFFNEKWEHQPFVGLHWPPLPNAEVQLVKPACYDEMLEIAAKLCKGIPFVRVDLYQVDGHPYFGEMTFYPYAGFGSFYPTEWNLRMGELITLPEK